jgi:hypothetical protein
MSFFVVDTNVPVVANGRSQQAGPDCVISCLNALDEIYRNGTIILDDKMLILREYMNNLNLSGQPGPGDAFMAWVYDNQAVTNRCKQVHITPLEEDSTNFIEFPQNDQLRTFDHSDRKFVAVACNCEVMPEILNAVDPDWEEYFDALSQAGLQIRFLCPRNVCLGR